jgi:hypothetical protein
VLRPKNHAAADLAAAPEAGQKEAIQMAKFDQSHDQREKLLLTRASAKSTEEKPRDRDIRYRVRPLERQKARAAKRPFRRADLCNIL